MFHVEHFCGSVRAPMRIFSNWVTRFTAGHLRRYNVLVPPHTQDRSRSEHHPRHHVYALETTGLLIIAATLLAITLVRYWYAIHWSLR